MILAGYGVRTGISIITARMLYAMERRGLEYTIVPLIARGVYSLCHCIPSASIDLDLSRTKTHRINSTEDHGGKRENTTINNFGYFSFPYSEADCSDYFRG